MLAAMAEAVAERGYVATPVADVIRRAGVSRGTFYEQFGDKEDCFLAAFDYVVHELTARMVAAVGRPEGRSPDDGLARLDRALAVYLDVLARERVLARTFLIEVYGAGPAALRRRAAVADGFVGLIAEAVGAGDDDRHAACEAFVGATSSMVTMRVATGDYDSLPGLREPLLNVARRLLTES